MLGLRGMFTVSRHKRFPPSVGEYDREALGRSERRAEVPVWMG